MQLNSAERMAQAPKDQALDRAAEALRYAQSLRAHADQVYKDAIKGARDVGVSNNKMAQILKISETAVRNYRKRHNL